MCAWSYGCLPHVRFDHLCNVCAGELRDECDAYGDGIPQTADHYLTDNPVTLWLVVNQSECVDVARAVFDRGASIDDAMDAVQAWAYDAAPLDLNGNLCAVYAADFILRGAL